MQLPNVPVVNVKPPDCPASVMIVTALVALASAFGIAAAFVAYPALYSRQVDFDRLIMMAAPLVALSVLNIAMAFCTQRGSLWAYCGLLALIAIDGVLLFFQHASPVPPAILFVVLLFGYRGFVDYWDYKEYEKFVVRYVKTQKAA